MHSQPADGPQARAESGQLERAAGSVFLLGPPSRTTPLAAELTSQGYACRVFAERDGFLDAMFNDPPWAAVLWEGFSEVDLQDVQEILRHQLHTRSCALVVAGSEGCSSPAPKDAGPACLTVSEAEVPARLKEFDQAGGEVDGSIPRVLVVDDDQSIVLLGSHIVSGLGMIPLVAFDGPEAVEKARKFKPDLLLLDINMPEMDGYGVIRALKADPCIGMMPIIVFSARRSEEDKVRALRMGADDYVTKPFSISELSARIDRLLKRTRTGMSASSTTGLPGTVSIEQVMSQRIRSGQEFAVLYLDLDNFKAFNDCYGFARGDSVIRQTGDIILEAVEELGNCDDFVGHIGGDDFVVITTPSICTRIADAIIGRFDRITPLYYDAKDRVKGFIAMEDRRGRRASFPLMSLSVAIVTNEGKDFHHPAQVADVAAQLKKYAKSRAGSVWVKDQRGNGGRRE